MLRPEDAGVCGNRMRGCQVRRSGVSGCGTTRSRQLLHEAGSFLLSHQLELLPSGVRELLRARRGVQSAIGLSERLRLLLQHATLLQPRHHELRRPAGQVCRRWKLPGKSQLLQDAQPLLRPGRRQLLSDELRARQRIVLWTATLLRRPVVLWTAGRLPRRRAEPGLLRASLPRQRSQRQARHHAHRP